MLSCTLFKGNKHFLRACYMLRAFGYKFSFNPQGIWVRGLILIYREVKKPQTVGRSPQGHTAKKWQPRFILSSDSMLFPHPHSPHLWGWASLMSFSHSENLCNCDHFILLMHNKRMFQACTDFLPLCLHYHAWKWQVPPQILLENQGAGVWEKEGGSFYLQRLLPRGKKHIL